MKHTATATWLATALVVCLGGATARADVAPAAEAEHAWHVGLNLRSDWGPHRIRVGGGARLGRLALNVVLDPTVIIDNNQNDIDAFGEWMFSPGGWAALAGWRTSSISIDRGRQWQQHLLIGASAGLPPLLDGRIRARIGSELVLSVVRHGQDLPTDWFSIKSQRHYRDLISVNLFLRFEYAAPL